MRSLLSSCVSNAAIPGYSNVEELISNFNTIGTVDLLCVNPVLGNKSFGHQSPDQLKSVILLFCPKIVLWVLHLSFVADREGEKQLLGWDQQMEALGYIRMTPWISQDKIEKVHVSNLSAAQSLSRIVLHYELRSMTARMGHLSELLADVSGSGRLKDVLDPISQVGTDLWLHGTFVRVPQRFKGSNIVQAGFIAIGEANKVPQRGQWVQVDNHSGWWLIVEMGLGLIRIAKSERSSLGSRLVKVSEICKTKLRKLQVLSVEGVGRAVLAWSQNVEGCGNSLILDERQFALGVRRLSWSEVVRLNGLGDLEISWLRSMKEFKSSMLDFWVGSFTPLSLSRALLSRARVRLLLTAQEDRLQIHCPALGYASGGARRQPRAQGEQNLGGLMVDLNRWSWSEPYVETVLVQGLVRSGIQTSTRSAYESAIKWWKVWRSSRNCPIWISSDPARRQVEEQDLCAFIAWRGLVCNMAHSTIHVTLHAIRRHHVESGFPDPLEDRRMVALTMAGLLRVQGGPIRKVPISMPVIRRLAGYLDGNVWDHLVFMTAIITMFLFLLRSGEALRSKAIPDGQKCLRSSMLVFRRNQVALAWTQILEADEVVLMMGKSKTDPLGQGSVANVFQEVGDPLCLLSLLKRMFRLNPTHFNPAASRFLFLMSNNKVLRAGFVTRLLRRVAQEVGLPKKSLSVISLRSGGASAMWDAGFSAEEIKMRGRWSSDCWKRYVWGGQNPALSVAEKLLGSTYVPLAAIRRVQRGQEPQEL